ncbi:MAG: 30S ribosomal protein S8 [Acidobacteria bacterium]|nr:30S ribosomal protein S8 [Acidobacteriota bacterium]
MSMTDPIADMLSRIRNAIQSRHDRVDVPASKLKVEIARILKEQGFISNYKKVDEGLQGVIRISLKYAQNGEPAIHGIERISRPGRRVYRARTEIPRPLGGLGLSIVSTSSGVLSGDEAAKSGIGGEVLCQVW